MHGNINNTWPGEWLVTSLKKSETQKLNKALGIEDEAKWLAKLLDLKYLSCCMKRYITQYPVIYIGDMTTCVSQFNHPVIIIGCKKGIDTNLTCDINICYMNIIEVNANECFQICEPTIKASHIHRYSLWTNDMVFYIPLPVLKRRWH